MFLRLSLPLFLLVFFLPSAALARTATPSRHAQTALPGLALSAAPQLVDAGNPVRLSVTARHWPGAASVSGSFVSPHHGFSGALLWKQGCGCFQVSVLLAKRIHPLETAKAKATVKLNGKSYNVSTSFVIRGLAPNGKDYAKGGQIFLRSWVGDPNPFIHQDEHICGWVTTADGLGVAGYHIHFAVHYPKKTQSWYSRATDRKGVACSQRKVLPVASKQTVRIDVSVANLKSSTSFTVTP